MQLKDLVELQMKLDDRVQFFWNFYIVFITALLAYILTQIQQISLLLRDFMIFGYFIFVAMNILGLLEVANLQAATKEEIRRLSDLDPDARSFFNAFCVRDYLKQRKWIFIIHGLSAIAVVGLILTINTQ